MTITTGNTVFGALDGGRPVDWGVAFQDLAQRLIAKVGKPKPTPISPFLFHLYESKGILTEEEKREYKTAQELRGYRITPEPISRPESEDKRQGEETGDPETVAASPAQEKPVQLLNQLKRMKNIYRASPGSSLVRSKGEGSLQYPQLERPQLNLPQPDKARPDPP